MMIMRRTRGVGVLLVIAAMAVGGGCEDRTLPPSGQLVIYVDTDAPLGSSKGSNQSLLESSGLFDRLRVEVLAPNGSPACAECKRDFVVTSEDLDAAKLSFGVKLVPNATGYRARVRFFVSDTRVNGDPRVDTTIDAVYMLPSHGEEGIVEVTAFVPFATIGQEADPAAIGAGAETTRGKVFRGERAVPRLRPQCTTSEAKPGEVCVPGGAFWEKRTDARNDGSDLWRAVVLSPFFIDDREVTVADMRVSTLTKANVDPRPSSGISSECTYTSEPKDFESLPVTCVSADLAERYCARKKSTLPTGAQLEYVRGRLTSQPYVWGFDAPTCYDAVWARGFNDGFNECASLGHGPQVAGRGARDRLTLPTGAVLDLMGNVAELISDWPADCTKSGGVLFDPKCGKPRGRAAWGTFHEDRSYLQTPVRSIPENTVDPRIGFRCVRADQ
jgi:formylglycine-generating enzyme required for sulfatase activity